MTLCGYSLGARVIFTCLEKLAEAGEKGQGIVEQGRVVGVGAQYTMRNGSIGVQGRVSDNVVPRFASGVVGYAHPSQAQSVAEDSIRRGWKARERLLHPRLDASVRPALFLGAGRLGVARGLCSHACAVLCGLLLMMLWRSRQLRVPLDVL